MFKNYKSLKIKQTEVRAVLNYKKDKKEFDAEYYELMNEYMMLKEDIEFVHFINYIIEELKNIFKKEDKAE